MFIFIATSNQKSNSNFEVLKLPTLPLQDPAMCALLNTAKYFPKRFKKIISIFLKIVKYAKLREVSKYSKCS